MGNWNITVRGQGHHHNKKLKTDANRLAAKFVEELKDAGHTVIAASITFGGEEDLKDAKTYLAGHEKADQE